MEWRVAAVDLWPKELTGLTFGQSKGAMLSRSQSRRGTFSSKGDGSSKVDTEIGDAARGHGLSLGKPHGINPVSR